MYNYFYKVTTALECFGCFIIKYHIEGNFGASLNLVNANKANFSQTKNFLGNVMENTMLI